MWHLLRTSQCELGAKNGGVADSKIDMNMQACAGNYMCQACDAKLLHDLTRMCMKQCISVQAPVCSLNLMPQVHHRHSHCLLCDNNLPLTSVHLVVVVLPDTTWWLEYSTGELPGHRCI